MMDCRLPLPFKRTTSKGQKPILHHCQTQRCSIAALARAFVRLRILNREQLFQTEQVSWVGESAPAMSSSFRRSLGPKLLRICCTAVFSPMPFGGLDKKIWDRL